MPVPLPLQPSGNINLPPLPGDPPSLQDVIKAKSFNTAVKVDNATQLPNSSTDEDKARASIYKTLVIVTHGQADAEPAWFAPALERGLARGLVPLTVTVYQVYNLQCHDGRNRKFKILPFDDGTMPTAPPNNLPALRNVDNIRSLTGPEATDYLVGYGLQHVHVIEERKQAIGRHIGCSVQIPPPQ